jgi:ribose/xylose/arabinose/galactoside ABC-type transport system permease subunit
MDGVEEKKGLRSLILGDFNRILSIVILMILMIVTSAVNPNFLSSANLLGILEQNAAKGMLALGATYVLITGGIDLSMGNMMTTIAVISTMVHFNQGESLFVLIVCCIALGAVSGCVNGFLITKLNLLPFVATLIMMSVSQGITLYAAEGKIIFLRNPLVLIIGSGKIFGGFPVAGLIFLLVAVAAAIVLYRTRLGISVYSLGGNEAAARYSGINITTAKFKVYVVNGIFVGLAALLSVCRIGHIMPSMGDGFMMDAIAAAVIGGTSTLGGKGTIFGTVIGVLIIGVLTNALTFLAVPIQGQSVVKGLVIIVAIVLDSLAGRFKK